MAAELKKGTQSHSAFLHSTAVACGIVFITGPECFQEKNKTVVRNSIPTTLQSACGHFYCTLWIEPLKHDEGRGVLPPDSSCFKSNAVLSALMLTNSI